VVAEGDFIGDGRRRLELLRTSLQADIVRLLERLDTKGGVLTADNLNNAMTVRTQVLDLLRVEGGPVAMTIAEQQSEAAARSALRKRNSKNERQIAPMAAITTEAEAMASVRATTSGMIDDIEPVWRDAADTIRQAIDRGVSTGLPLRDLVAEVKDRLKIAKGQSEVVVEAAIRGAVTRATVMSAENAAQAAGETMGYLYDGPLDQKTRPFCDEVIGKVYTLAALKSLDNGQGLPVESHRGGYRCRHRLSPILLSDAEEEGYEVIR
jgi:hypothetical protein